MSRLAKVVVLVFCMLLFSAAALAQTTTLSETADNGAFAVDYPSGWLLDAFLSEDAPEVLRPVVIVYSSTAVQDVVMAGGDVVLPAGGALAYLTSNADGMLTVRATMDELIELERAAGSKLGEVTEITTQGYDGLIMSIESRTGNGFAGVLGSRELRVTFILLAAPGDLERYTPTFQAMINSIRPGRQSAGDQRSSTPAPTQTGTLTLAYGDTVTGFISDNDGDVWTFAGQAGDVINISMTAVALDSYLEVYTPNGALLAEDDDSGGQFNARIEGLQLPATGTYRIVARTFGGSGRGAYELALSTSGAPSRGGVGAVADESVVSVREGNLPLGQTERYTFTGRARQVVTIQLESSALSMDPFLNLYNSAGELVVQDDDSAGNLNAIIENFTLPRDDTYTIEVTTAYGDGGGVYRLTLVGAELDGVQTAMTIPAAPGQMIAIGDVIRGNLPLGESIDYTFQGRAGMLVTITLESSAASMDPYLELRDPSMRLIAEDDDSAGNLNARISRMTLPSDGIYTIVVRTFGGRGGGQFTLTLR